MTIRKIALAVTGTALAALALSACGSDSSTPVDSSIPNIGPSASTSAAATPSVSGEPSAAASGEPTAAPFPTVTGAPSVPSKQGDWKGVLAGTPAKTFDTSVGQTVTIDLPAPSKNGVTVLGDEAYITELVSTPEQMNAGKLVYKAKGVGVTRVAVGAGKPESTNAADWTVYEIKIA